MEFVNLILEVILRLFDCCANRAPLVLDLHESTTSLRNALDELKALRDDTKSKVDSCEQQQMRIKKQVEDWLRRVEDVKEEANQALQRGEREVQSKCFVGYCPKNCHSASKTAQKVVKMIGKVEKEITKGKSFSDVADELLCVGVNKKPMERTVGLESLLGKAWALLEDSNVGILGLYGMGGVGKTTLLAMMNNEFVKRNHPYELVVWVVVSRRARVDQVQEAIFNRVKIVDPRWSNKRKDEKATTICQFFNKKRFVLLLDDVWERLDLLEVGIPQPDSENKCKVMFSTRSQEVCGQMEAHRRIDVPCLKDPEALALFNQKVGQETLTSHPEIQSLAEQVARECSGLPLALITIGRAMSSKKDPQEWRRAIEVLKSYPYEISGMGDHVYRILKFSYDSLRDETDKSCFLYCSIFPEDYNITKVDLVELWMGEGFIDKAAYDTREARNLGSDIVERLKLACLLEVGNEPDSVKMHDVIRDMALWLSCTDETKRHQIVVEDRATSIDSRELVKWNQAKRVTLWKAKSISGSSSFINLSTLFIRYCKMTKLPPQLFHHMPSIRVLDLSSNTYLTELPNEIKQLVSLRYLNLSSTRLHMLPMSLDNLTELRYLLLDNMEELESIPPEPMQKLTHLRVLSIIPCMITDVPNYIMQKYTLSLLTQLRSSEVGTELLLLEELGHLKWLDDLRMSLSEAKCVEKLLTCEKLSTCISWLCLARCRGLSKITFSSSSIERLKNLKTLEIMICRQLNGIKVESGCFRSLCSVKIVDSQLVELTWLVYAPCLEFLEIQRCNLLKVVVSNTLEDKRAEQMFARLRRITLFHLPCLESICPQTLPFPCLELMDVMSCPLLRKLPFNTNTKTDVLSRIVGLQDWWQKLQWEDEHIKLTFQAFFRDFYLNEI